MYGKMTATQDGTRQPSLVLKGDGVGFYFYRCSVKALSEKQFFELFRPSIDVLSPEFSREEAALNLRKAENAEKKVCDILLDQSVFAGVGNIIKNETLFNAGILPERLCGSLSRTEVNNLVNCAKDFSVLFLNKRMSGQKLSGYSHVYFRSKCSRCGGKISRSKCGTTGRITFWCPKCQK